MTFLKTVPGPFKKNKRDKFFFNSIYFETWGAWSNSFGKLTPPGPGTRSHKDPLTRSTVSTSVNTAKQNRSRGSTLATQSNHSNFCEPPAAHNTIATGPLHRKPSTCHLPPDLHTLRKPVQRNVFPSTLHTDSLQNPHRPRHPRPRMKLS